MTDTVTITEGTWLDTDLTDAEADALRALGRTLASRTEWWGATSGSERIDSRRTVIEVERAHTGPWRLRIAGSVGIVHAGATTIVVQPKIPTAQFVDLLHIGSGTSRTSDTGTHAADGDLLHDIIERWFLDAASHLVAHGLLCDYIEREEPLNVARGSVDHLRTASALLTGTLAIHCRYEDYELDTPHNRMLRAGLAVVVRSRDEQRARIASRLMGEVRAVGSVRPLDWHATFDRRSRIYEPVARLAKMLVDGTALALDSTGVSARCFLLRSAPVFEQGIREAIRRHLTARGKVTPGRILSTTGDVRFDPDILIDTHGDRSVADVKYRDLHTDWDSNTRNQIVAFATAAQSTRGAVIGIERAPARTPRPFSLHDLQVTPIGWKAWHDSPLSALTADIEQWLA